MMRFNLRSTRKVQFDVLASAIRPPSYTGETQITPSHVEQVLSTSNRYMETDVVVAAIPKEYGLVTFTAVVPTAANIMVS